MSVSQQTAKKFFSLQSRCGLNASRQSLCPQKYYKAMKITYLVGDVCLSVKIVPLAAARRGAEVVVPTVAVALFF